MKKTLLISLLFINTLLSFAGPGDTVVVQAFRFGSPQDAWFVFPKDTMRCEKILMKYTLKCDPAQSPACGEWDYLTYTYLYKHTGLIDSSFIHQPVYTVDGNTPDSISYMNTPSYSYHPSWQFNIVHSDTSSFATHSLGSGSISSNAPFGTSAPVSRTQYLWRADEMITAGISPGSITGLQFYLQTLGGEMHNLTISIKATTLDSLAQSTFTTAGFTTVYSHTTQFATTGWNSLQLTTPFNWDGTSNLLIDIAYDNAEALTDNVISCTATTYTSGLTNSGADRVAAFHSYGYVSVPMNDKLATIDSAVTVAFWCFGAPAQPMEGTAFEAVDSIGDRLLNSHLPWSDSNVYWDAGYRAPSYDRINKLAVTSEIKGQWNYWAFTKKCSNRFHENLSQRNFMVQRYRKKKTHERNKSV